MTKIFIEDFELDIDNGISNNITYAIDDLQNIDSKATSFTKTIILPGTANNNKLLGNIFEFNNSNFTLDALQNVGYNFNASKAAKCRIECDGLLQIKGVFRLLEIIIDGLQVEYECSIFGELGGFVSKLSNKKLEDLDFSSYDHNYTVSNITTSWANDNTGDGYYYPLIDYGNVSVNKKDFQVKAFRPALHVREYIDKIITNAGYTWQSDFFNTDFFKRLIVPNNGKSLMVPKNQIFYSTSNLDYYLNENVTVTNSAVYVDNVTIPSFVGGLFTTSNNKEFTYTGTSTDINLSFAIAMNFNISGGIINARKSIYSKFEIIKNGDVVFYNGQIYGRSNNGSQYAYFSNTTTLSLDTSDVISVRVTTTIVNLSLGTANFILDVIGNSITIDSPVPVLSPAEIGDLIRFNEIQPKNIFQKDFFTSILKMFNLMVTEDKDVEKKLIIEPYINFFDTTPSSYLDWNYKVDYGKPIRITPMSELNARVYKFKYKQDSDYYNENYRKRYSEGYGDRVFDNGFEFAKDTQQLEVIFSNSVLTGFSGEDKVFPAIFKKSNGIEDSIDHNIRIMQAKMITGVASWNILNNTTILTSTTNYPYAGHLDDPDAPDADLCFGVPLELQFALVSGNLSNNLFNAYYSPYMAEITDKDSRLVAINMKLTAQDIYNLDFSKFRYINGGIYRLNKIIDYNPGDNSTVKCEFLRVIYTTY